MVEPLTPRAKRKGPEPFRRARPISLDRRRVLRAARGGATPVAGATAGPEITVENHWWLMVIVI